MNLNINPCLLNRRKQLFNVKEGRKDGLLLQVHCSQPEKQNVYLKPDIRFTNLTFNHIGQILIAATSKGDIYNINFTQSRYWHLTNTSSCTFLKFNLLNNEEVFIGKNSGIIIIIDVESGELINTLKGHKYPVKDASFAKDFICVSSSDNEAIVWDLRSYTKVQVLCMSSTVLKKVMFIPVSDDILTCFNDDSIHIWKYGTFENIKKIQPALWNKFVIKCLTFTRNGRVSVIGGYSQNLAVFLTDTWELQKTIVLPTPINAVKQLDFVPQPFDGGSNRVLSVLTSNGLIYFYDMQKDVILNRMMFDVEIIKYDLSYDGRYVACVTSNGKISVYLLASYVNAQEDGTRQTVKSEGNIKRSSIVSKKCLCALYTAKIKIDDILDIEKLLSILKEYGRYPEMHRFKIWTRLLQLPYNVEQYQILNNKYAEVKFQDLEKKYPIENRILLKNLKRLLFALSLWCPFFGEVTYLPLFSFPFVKVFQNDPLICFEAVITIIMNWCQYWFEYYPLPPINILAMIENIFLHQDPTLLKHLTMNEVTSKIYAWSLLQTAFSEVLSSQDWLILWDHILSNEPSYLIMVTVAYNLLQKNHLMALSDLKDFKVFYLRQNLIDVKRLISKAYQLVESTEDIFHPRRYLENFQGLEDGIYPVFLHYPKAVVDYQRNIQSLRSTRQISTQQEKEILDRTIVECEKIKQAKRKIEEHIRMKEVDSLYKQKLQEEQESAKRQTQRLDKLKEMLGSKSNFSSSSANTSSTSTKLRSEGNFTNKKLYECKPLCHYREFLETDYAVCAYTAKECHKVVIPHTFHNEIDRKMIDAISKATTLDNPAQYFTQLAVTTGLKVLDKIISRLKTSIKERSGENRNISQSYITFMIEQIDLTEQRIETLLKDLSADVNSVQKIQFNVLKGDSREFRSSMCDGSGISSPSV